MEAPRVPRRPDFAAILAFAFLAVALTSPLVLHLTDHVASDVRDPMYCLWLLSWDVNAAIGNPAGIADANIFYPHRGALFYGDALPVLALMAAPVIILTRNPVLAYNLLFLVSFFIAGYGMFLLARRLTSSRSAAFVAGLIFAYFPYNFAHLSHLELLFYGWIPYCFLFIHRYFDTPSFKNMAGIAFFYVLQVLSCAYYGQYMTFFVGLTALYYAVRTRAFRRPRFWRDAGIAAALAAAVLGPYFFTMLQVHRRMLFVRAIWEVKAYSAELQHFLAVPPLNHVWGWLTGRIGGQEWQLFPGLVPMALSLVWLWARKSKAICPAAAPAMEAGARPLARTPAPASVPGFARGSNAATKVRPSIKKKSPGLFRVWDAANILLFFFVVYLGIWGGRGVTVAGIWISTRTLQDPTAILLLSLILRVLLDARVRRRWAAGWSALAAAEKAYSVLTASAWLLSFGPVIRILGREVIAGPYAIFFNAVPGFKNVRVPARFAVMMMLGLSVLSAWGLQRILGRRKSAKAGTIVAGIVAGLVIVESLAIPIPLSPVPVKRGIPEIYAEVAKLPADAVLVELPMPLRDGDESDEAAAVYYSSYHRRRIVNGYSGNAPPGYRVVREAMAQFPSEETLVLLRDLAVDYILIHAGGAQAERGAEILRRLLKFSPLVEVIAERRGDSLVRLKFPATDAPRADDLRETGDRRKWSAAAGLNPKDAALAFDGDLMTGWSTGYPQRAGDTFELDLGETLAIRGIELRLGNNPLDFPRNFTVDGSADGMTWTRLSERTGFFPAVTLGNIEDVMNYVVPVTVGPTPIEPASVRLLRFVLTRSHEERHWSIAEISVLK